LTTILFVLQIVITIILVIAILLQKSSSIGLGAYSGSNESLFGAKGPAGFLAKFTAVMAILFVANTIALSVVYQGNSEKSIIDDIKLPDASELPAATNDAQNPVPSLPSVGSAPIVPIAPAAPKNENINIEVVDENASEIPATDMNATSQTAQESNSTEQNATQE